jgi:hypothetical protein
VELGGRMKTITIAVILVFFVGLGLGTMIGMLSNVESVDRKWKGEYRELRDLYDIQTEVLEAVLKNCAVK